MRDVIVLVAGIIVLVYNIFFLHSFLTKKKQNLGFVDWLIIMTLPFAIFNIVAVLSRWLG